MPHIDRPTGEQIADIAVRLGYPSVARDAGQFASVISGLLAAYDAVDSLEPDPPDRTEVTCRVPGAGEDPGNAWAVRAEITGSGSGPLAGRRVGVKDSIMVAGVPMASGSGLLEGYLPEFDATVVRRVLDAGATIVGKTNCEYLCLDGGSHTSSNGVTHNPRRRGWSAGGSCSGNAVAIVTGQADLALGADQAGSIRVPASFSGLVGLKPTHGLVPYTGIMPLDPAIDHAGPMSATVADNALLLGVIAGADEYDPRQRNVRVGDYLSDLDAGVRGLRIGVLAEGFGQDGGEPDVDEAVRRAAADLARLGADVVDVSVPIHAIGAALWTPIVMHGMAHSVVAGQGFGVGRADRYPVGLIDHLFGQRGRAGEMPPTVTVCAVLAEYVRERRGISCYARAVNAARRLTAGYDRALRDVHVLLLPTTPQKAQPLPAEGAPVADYFRCANDMFGNTAPFNATGHPALSLPCGDTDGLPIGLMLVGRHFDEATVYRAAHAYEQRRR
jgi:amidase